MRYNWLLSNLAKVINGDCIHFRVNIIGVKVEKSTLTIQDVLQTCRLVLEKY